MSKLASIIYVLLHVLVTLKQANSNCAKWTSIDPSEYSQTFVTVTAANASLARPLGYMPMRAKFGDPKKPCVTVDGTSGNGRHYEVSIDSPTGYACITPPGQNSVCTNAQISRCDQIGTGNTMTFTFDCRSCEGSAVNFWYRIVIESDTDGNYDENWCQTRTPSYPISLKSEGDNVVIPTPLDQDPGGSSAKILAQSQLLAILLIFSISLSKQ